MPESAIVRKLGIKPGHRVLLKGAPDIPANLGSFPEGVMVDVRGRSGYDCVLVFARKAADLRKVAPSAIAAVKEAGLLWICYSKLGGEQESDLKRDLVWEAVAPTGWRPVSQVAVDQTWSALRFRPVADVKPRGAGKAKPSARKTAAKKGTGPKRVARRRTSRPGTA